MERTNLFDGLAARRQGVRHPLRAALGLAMYHERAERPSRRLERRASTMMQASDDLG
jgi:hypothetical protein